MDVTGKVVVVTGASSGIGRETALEFGRRGASIAIAARNEQALRTLSAEVERLGGEALPVVTDVSDYDQVKSLAAKAVERFGRIDIWVNNAAVATYGYVDQMEPDELRRVIDVNLMGHIHGMHAALPYLETSAGTLINVSSALGKRAIPLQAAYGAAKHGIVAFGEALRLELRALGSPVRVTDVLVSSINTPLFDHARSKIGVAPKPVGRVYEPSVVAEAIIRAAERPVRQVYAGYTARLFEVAQRISPSLVDWYLSGPGDAIAGQRTDLADDGFDNLFSPCTGGGSVTGRFGGRSKSISLYTRTLGVRPAAGLATAVAGLAAATMLLLRLSRKGGRA